MSAADVLGSPGSVVAHPEGKQKKRGKNQRKPLANGRSVADSAPDLSRDEDADNGDGRHVKHRQNKKIKFGETEAQSVAETVPVKAPAKRERETRVASPVVKKSRRTNVTFHDREETDQELGATGGEDDDDDDVLLKQRKPRAQLQERAKALLGVRESLPVYRVRQELTRELCNNTVTVLIGETGSGKSTQIPQFLMAQQGKGCIAVTQPRRVAAINLANRVAEEHGCNVGQEVGYSVRFQNASQNNTKLKYLTDGMLLRELMLDNDLKRYSTVVIDEAHERTILTDLLLGFLKQLLQRRAADGFKIIVMSATLDAERFSKFFNDAPIFYVEGKMYPVERFYLPKPTEDVVDSIVKVAVQLNQSEPEGDVLCFLPGQEEIDKAVAVLANLAPDLPKEAPYIVPLPLYAALPTAQQVKIFQPVAKRQRKIILSTNIAETSVTVPGIKYVVDSGLRKVKAWKHELGLSTLLTAPISQASATQRAGRAGRESAGKCFRLYTESDYYKLPPQTDPEIIRSDVVSPVLILKKMKVENLYEWPWLEHPGEKSLKSSLLQLLSLGALDPKDGSITSLGEKMTVLPLAPQLSAVLITARELGVLGPVIDIISCLSVDNLLMTPSNDRRDEVNERRRNFSPLGSRHGDLVALKEFFDHLTDIKDKRDQLAWCKELDISYKGFKNVLRVKRQLKDYMAHLYKDLSRDDDGDDEDGFMKAPLDIPAVLKSFLKGFINNTAIGMPDRSYRTVMGGNLISVHPSSLLFGSRLDAIMYIEYVFTTKGYGRTCSRIELSWLQEVAPHLLGTRISAK